MEEVMVCPDCNREHSDPGEASLGLRVRCIDCALDLELAFVATVLVHVAVSPAERPAA
ncbi:MAG TPA: hypothetical protein VN905_13070 [Candidatus Binatia bacterium]|nr:hypothetical protein [Candidatus Binatia bacterium]